MSESTIAKEFIRGVVAAVFQAAVRGTARLLESPPGRSPDQRLLSLSSWYLGLSSEDRERVRDVVALAADQSVFGMLAGLDGSRRLLSNDLTLDLRVEGMTTDGWIELTLDENLHDLYRQLVDPCGELQPDDL